MTLKHYADVFIQRLYGPIQEVDMWRIRYNEELNRSINGGSIVKFVKAQTIRWLHHVKRMEVGEMPRRMMEDSLQEEEKEDLV
jgi:hypothetical protein